MFIEDLRKGLPGVRIAVPEAVKVQEERERQCVFTDGERRVGWHVVHAPWRLDLGPETDAVLRDDLARHARYSFEDHYQQLTLPEGQAATRPPVRTSDAAWSPLISIERVRIGDAPALKVLRRVFYEPAIEVVVGTLLIPLANGVCDITAFQRTGETGHRERQLLGLAQKERPHERPEELARSLGQAHFDDARHDESFSTHPLTCVRRALSWLLEPDAGRLAVLAPAPAPARGELELQAPGCAIVPPPRYLPVPQGVLPTPPTMAVLTRVTLEAAENPRMMDVWQLIDAILKGPDRSEELLELARRNAAQWEKQGAADLRSEIRLLPAEGERLLVCARLSMQLSGAPARSLTYWIGEPDGRVFRIAVGAPPYVSMDELDEDARAVLRSFRRLPEPVRSAWLTSDLSLRKRPEQR